MKQTYPKPTCTRLLGIEVLSGMPVVQAEKI